MITAKAREFISRRAPRGRPFFLHVAYTAPHRSKGARPQPPDNCGRSSQPAARHANAFDSAPLPQGGSLNEREVSDKPREVRRLPRLHQDDIRSLTRRYRCTVESLQSVDEGVAGIVEDLAVAGELASTILIFTSDNGFFFSEHRIRSGKNRIYEEATRVPLVIRGPGFGRGRESERLAVNADLTRTILDAANADPRLPQDGVSLLRPAGGRKAISIETRQVDAVRTPVQVREPRQRRPRALRPPARPPRASQQGRSVVLSRRPRANAGRAAPCCALRRRLMPLSRGRA